LQRDYHILSSGVLEYVGSKLDSMRPGRLGAWAYVVLMMAAIVISLPLTPILWRAALRAFGPRFNVIGYVLLAIVFLGFTAYMIRSRARLGFSGFPLLLTFALVYLWLLKYLCQVPADRIHLLEYGLLACLLRTALRIDFSSIRAYVFGFLIAAGFGVLDECVQHFLPNRVFEVRDILANVVAAGLGLLVVALLIRPDSVKTLSNETGACS
jgi:hypothetical protein